MALNMCHKYCFLQAGQNNNERELGLFTKSCYTRARISWNYLVDNDISVDTLWDMLIAATRLGSLIPIICPLL